MGAGWEVLSSGKAGTAGNADNGDGGFCPQQDAAIEAAYGVGFEGDEEKMVAHLFEPQAKLTA